MPKAIGNLMIPMRCHPVHAILVPIPEAMTAEGQLLRSVGYAEAAPAESSYQLSQRRNLSCSPPATGNRSLKNASGLSRNMFAAAPPGAAHIGWIRCVANLLRFRSEAPEQLILPMVRQQSRLPALRQARSAGHYSNREQSQENPKDFAHINIFFRPLALGCSESTWILFRAKL